MTSWNYFTKKGSKKFYLHAYAIKQGTQGKQQKSAASSFSLFTENATFRKGFIFKSIALRTKYSKA